LVQAAAHSGLALGTERRQNCLLAQHPCNPFLLLYHAASSCLLDPPKFTSKLHAAKIRADMETNNEIRQRRKALGLTQQELAASAQTSQMQVSRLENFLTLGGATLPRVLEILRRLEEEEEGPRS
jgi:hypothetical protein